LSTNKHAIIRYQTLDKCFRNTGRKYAIDDLVEACNQSIYDFTGKDDGIKKRQLYDDICFMGKFTRSQQSLSSLFNQTIKTKRNLLIYLIQKINNYIVAITIKYSQMVAEIMPHFKNGVIQAFGKEKL
jgi:hypothetical protein